MSDLVGNPEDRFSQNEAQIARINGMFRFVGILIYMSNINFMLKSVEHEKSFMPLSGQVCESTVQSKGFFSPARSPPWRGGYNEKD